MTGFPSIEWPPQPSQRMSELLEEAGPANPELAPDTIQLTYKKGALDLEHGPIQDPFLHLWLVSMKFFLQRRKGDWGVFFQLGVRDLENFWRDNNTQEVFDISEAHLEFEKAWQSLISKKLAACLGQKELTSTRSNLSYPEEVSYWMEQVQALDGALARHVDLELVSFEKKEVLAQEEKRAPKADRLVFELSWPSLGQTWTESAKQRWTKNFFATLEQMSQQIFGREVKWVAEGGQFP